VQYSVKQQIQVVEWEIKRRQKVYQRLVASGKMRQVEADYQIGVMKAVLVTLNSMKEHMDLVKTDNQNE